MNRQSNESSTFSIETIEVLQFNFVYCVLHRAMNEIGYFENWYCHICICKIPCW